MRCPNCHHEFVETADVRPSVLCNEDSVFLRRYADGALYMTFTSNTILYGQDFSFFRGVPVGVLFKVSVPKGTDYIVLQEQGYGDKNDYGSGSLFVKLAHLPQQIRAELKAVK